MADDTSVRFLSPYERPDWVAAQVIWVVYFTLTMYMLMGLILYLYRHRHEPQVRRRRGLFMYGFVVLAFVLAAVEMGINEWGILKMSNSGHVCERWRQSHHLAFITSLAPGYIFLWIRQHAFYKDAMLKTLTNRKLAWFSWVVLASFFVGFGFFISFFGSPAYNRSHEYVVMNYACFSGKHKNVSTLFYSIAIAFLIFYQTSLLFLFTYPIWKSNQEDEEMSETMVVIMGYIRKCRLLTIITAGTDIIAFACSLFLKRIWNAPLTVLTTIYDIDLLINLCCLLFCLKPWKDIVFPFRRKRCPDNRVPDKYRDSYVNSDIRSEGLQLQYRTVRQNSESTSVDGPAPHHHTVCRMVSVPEDENVSQTVI